MNLMTPFSVDLASSRLGIPCPLFLLSLFLPHSGHFTDIDVTHGIFMNSAINRIARDECFYRSDQAREITFPATITTPRQTLSPNRFLFISVVNGRPRIANLNIESKVAIFNF